MCILIYINGVLVRNIEMHFEIVYINQQVHQLIKHTWNILLFGVFYHLSYHFLAIIVSLLAICDVLSNCASLSKHP